MKPTAMKPGVWASAVVVTLGAAWGRPALAAPPGAGDYATALLSLVLILAGFVAAAWLVKRWLPRAPAGSVVKLVGATAVGAKERVVVVEIADTWLVLGVGGGQVNTLHTLPKAAVTTGTAAPASAFPPPADEKNTPSRDA
jgi:flagellar protein FliO/FliZ